MRKKTVLNRIVLRAKAGIVSDADFNSDAIDQRLQVFLEDVVAGVVVAAGVAQPDVIEKVPVLMAEGKPLDELLPDQWALANPDKVLLNRDHENRQAQERKNKKRMARRTATA